VKFRVFSAEVLSRRQLKNTTTQRETTNVPYTQICMLMTF